MFANDEIVAAFVEESREALALAERALIDLEAKPKDDELLRVVYRAMHTVKGTCGFLGFPKLEGLAHAAEDLLDAVRNGSLAMDVQIAGVVLKVMDRLRGVITVVESTGDESDDDHAELIAEIGNVVASGMTGQAVDARASDTAEASKPDAARASADSQQSSTVRVDVGVLDTLMDLVGELVLSRSQIGDLAANEDDGPLVLAHRQLARVSSEIQENVMLARLQPIGVVIGKFPRIARDLAISLGKQVRVELEGEGVGVDRAVNEALREALTHLVRNAVDHGIESPEARAAAGKPVEGVVRIAAAHVGGRVHIEVSDDGRGVDPRAILDQAVSAGVLTSEAASEMSDDDAYRIMFRNGISTKSAVTKISGRGVGMDAVQTALDSLGATIDVAASSGAGTTFRISVPLTLTIAAAVGVSAGGQRFALPQAHVREALHLEPEDVAESVYEIDGARVHRLRGHLLPLVGLSDFLGVYGETDGSAARDASLNIVVVSIDGRSFGLVVDEVGDTSEMVVKPPPRAIRGVAAYSGVTILFDGAPALIIDLAGIADAVGLTANRSEAFASRVEQEAAEIDPAYAAGESSGAAGAAAPGSSLLLATVAGAPFAVPLATVARLEQFPLESVRRSGDADVVEYDDALLPLLHVARVLDANGDMRIDRASPEAAVLSTIVCRGTGGLVGLVVDRIEDVVAHPAVAAQPANRPGVRYRVVVDGRATEILDVDDFLDRAYKPGGRR